MSKKSTKKSKQLSVPRTMAEIQTAYQQLCSSAGQLQYQMKIYSKELDALNLKLEAVNNEAAARNQLDAQTAAKEAATTNKTSEVGQGMKAAQQATAAAHQPQVV